MKIFPYLSLVAATFLALSFHGKKIDGRDPGPVPPVKYDAYLFAYFTGNAKDEEAIRFALSDDGYHFKALNGNKPVLSSAKISSTGGVRDPHILRGEDGKTFYMVATDMVSANGWNSNHAMVLMKSTDLINWSSSVVNIQQAFPGNEELLRVWAPQTIYDPAAKKYMIYWSMKHGKDPDKIYYAYANAAFSALETAPKQLFFSPTNNACIDGDIVYKDKKYYLFFKTETDNPGIKLAVSDRLTEGYVQQEGDVQQTKDAVEGVGVFKLNSGRDYIVMYDVYKNGRYMFTRSNDFKKFAIVDQEISMDFHPRHGTVMPVTRAEAQALLLRWTSPAEVITNLTAKAAKKINVRLDTAAGKLIIPVNPNTSFNSFDPGFKAFPGVTITPRSPQNFSNGPVNYTISIKGQSPATYAVELREYHNPVLDGYYADPDILYSEKNHKYYIYPTSDGHVNWSGTSFKTFSSPDLVNWKEERVILDLPKDVSWGKQNAWAPCIIEKKINGRYKYFYYFTAAKKIGVAVADDPAGPFKDSGKPLIDQMPDGVTRGQLIDPDVFADPKTGRTYLYWGNAFMAAAELNDDMISLKPGTTRIITPSRSYNEGTYVFYRNGKYYFTWSENDTRSPDYLVRYGISDSPLGPIKTMDNNILIRKNEQEGIYGTGHHSVLQIPGKDEWYLVYHRLNYPKGISMGSAAGYFREVCIDKLEFNADGTPKQVIPTHEGIKPVIVQGK